ncbi:hypothetical protein Taro_049855 [Colocasia esculenta]|uniref:Uncharacterized protein n=1 Tax=Colocasia esculenta TaxID=4460 RepID=A0A843XC69_COLES|nr:hypothetical protein [Colocasia esculenta]
MATSTVAALRWAVLFLLALSLFSSAPVDAQRRPNLCNLPPYRAPGRNCAAIRCLRYDPVCGVNGVTYGCGCPEANCYAVRVVKRGAC